MGLRFRYGEIPISLSELSISTTISAAEMASTTALPPTLHSVGPAGGQSEILTRSPAAMDVSLIGAAILGDGRSASPATALCAASSDSDKDE